MKIKAWFNYWFNWLFGRDVLEAINNGATYEEVDAIAGTEVRK